MAEDIIVRYRAEVDEATRKLELFAKANEELATDTKSAAKAIDNTTKSVDKLEKEVSDTGTKVKSANSEIKKLESTGTQSFNRLGSSIKSFGAIAAGALVAAFSVDVIKQFSQASIESFLNAEKAAEELKFAIVTLGGESEDVFDRLIRQSSEIQKVSIFGDDAIQQAQSALAAFGLTGNQIEKLIPKLADFATITGTDIVSAAQKVGQGLAGEGRAFEKFGINVKNANTPLENYNTILEGLEKQSGAAEEATKTLSGQLAQLNNEADDLQESIGARLAPIFVTLKIAAFEAVAGLLGFKKATDELNKQTNDNFVSSFESLAKRLEASGKNVEEEFTKTVEKVSKQTNEIKKKNDTLNEQIGERIALLNKSTKDFNPQNDPVIISLNEQISKNIRLIDLNNQKTTVLKDYIARLREQQVIDERTLTADELKNRSIEELNSLLKINQSLNDVISNSNVILIERELAVRRKLTDELKRYQKQLRDLQIGNIDDEEFKIRANFADTINELKATGQLRSDIILELVKKLNKDLLVLNERRLEDEQKQQAKSDAAFFKSLDERTQRTKKQQEESIKLQQDAQQIIFDSFIEEESKQPYLDRLKTFNTLEFELTQELKQKTKDLQKEFDLGEIATLDDLNNKKVILNKEYADKIKAIFNGLGLDLADGNNTFFDKYNDEIQASLDLLSTFRDLYATITNANIQEIEREKEARLKAIDEQLSANEQALNKRQISERTAAANEKRLLDEKTKAEEEAAKKERELKRRQAIADKAAALIQIAINTAVNISKAGNPFLIALYAATGAAQAAIVASQPIPYAKGTKSAKAGLSRVGEQGEEIMYVPQGTKVLPNGKTNKYGEVLDSMFDNRFETYVLNRYVNPALQKQKKDYEGRKSESFAQNIAKSVSVSKEAQGLTDFGMHQIMKKGSRITNADEIADALASRLKTSMYRR